MSGPADPRDVAAYEAAFTLKTAGTSESDAVARAREALARQHAVITKPGDPGGYRGEYDCSDCCSMTHCETHHKDEGLYPFDTDDESLDRGVVTVTGINRGVVSSTQVLKDLTQARRFAGPIEGPFAGLIKRDVKF